MTPLLPDCTHVRAKDARDIADAVVRCLREGILRLWVYLGPDGSVGFSLTDNEMPPLSLVGTYDTHATRGEIEEDILASQRESIA